MSESGFRPIPALRAFVALMALACLAALGGTACTPRDVTADWPVVQPDGSLVLVSGGYGYEVADIVLIDTEKVPVPGDVVQYDDRLNRTDCHAFGPGQYVARVVAVSGAVVTFDECVFTSACYLGAIECGPGISPRTQNVCWGDDWYDDVVGLSLTVPEGEYLANRWIGQECREVGGESLAGSRFTIKSDAVIGVVVKKLGHDDRMQEYLEGIRY